MLAFADNGGKKSASSVGLMSRPSGNQKNEVKQRGGGLQMSPVQAVTASDERHQRISDTGG